MGRDDMDKTLIIHGRLPGLNELIDAERTHRQAGAALKRKTEQFIRMHIREQLRGYHPKPPVTLYYYFYEPNKRRDLDNIAGFAHKVIQDSLVKERVIENDGWDHIKGFYDSFHVCKEFPRIEVEIVECQKEKKNR